MGVILKKGSLSVVVDKQSKKFVIVDGVTKMFESDSYITASKIMFQMSQQNLDRLTAAEQRALANVYNILYSTTDTDLMIKRLEQLRA